MGDSETVVAHSYPPVDYANSNSNPDQEAAVLTNGQDVTNKTVPDGPIEVEGGPTTMEHDSNPSNGVSHTGEKTEGVENSSLDSDLSKLAAFQSSINETEAGEARPDDALAGVVENGTDVHGSAAEPQDGSALTAEEERLWSIIRANSSDFNAWTALIEETEKAGESKVYSTTPWKNHQILATFRYSNHQVNISKIRRVYDAFLAEFPLCYGYWKKYADHEAHLSSIEKVVEVYERAVQGVTYSVEIWTHYCAFATSTYGDPDAIRRLFERGLAYVGTDYLSFQLWDKYIEYEYMQQEWSHLALIYTRILENPNEQLDRYFNSFKELAASRPLSELKAAEESAPAVVNSEAGAQEVKEEADPSVSEGSDKPASAGSAGLTEAEELEKYVAIREEMYNKAKEFDSKIVSFEKAIRRPYFHVKPLNAVELENWHNYLDFLEGEDDFPKIVKLYERCLVACANYPEFWIRYILCMEAKGSLDLANNALARATQVFVKRQPEIHLFAALLKEEAGDIAGARAAYQLVHTEISPGLLEAIIKHANMEHRLGKLEDAYSVYEQAIAIEKGKEHSQTLSFVFAQYARFLLLVSGNVEKAREVLVQALENIQLSKPLLEALIHLESIQGTHKQIGYIDSLVEKFVVPSSDNSSVASVSEREELSSIFLEFLDLFGDAQSIKKAHVRHAKLFSHHKSTSESRKRSAEDFLVSEKAKQAKSYPGVASSSPSVMGAYPNAQNPWAAYGAQPQAWPQATQPQAQQWNPAYTQQAAAAYGAYGSYGASYPQAPTSVPQPAAAYGAYPQAAYPAQQQQAVAQQSYAQPAVAAVVTPAQQAAPQSYYGTYY